MQRTLLLTAFAVLASSASAQVIRGGPLGVEDIKYRIFVGGGQTDSFTNNAAQSVRLQGPEIGIDLPLQRPVSGGPILMFTPSVLLGGQLSSGGDADGYVYRALIGMFTPLGAKGFYTRFCIGWSFAQSRGHQFGDESGFAPKYTLGYGLSMGDRAPVTATLELSYHNASESVLSGFSFGTTIRF